MNVVLAAVALVRVRVYTGRVTAPVQDRQSKHGTTIWWHFPSIVLGLPSTSTTVLHYQPESSERGTESSERGTESSGRVTAA